MGKRYESKRGEVRDAREEGERISTDKETLKNEYSLLSSIDSILGDIDDEVVESVVNVENVGEQEGTRLETEHQENDTEKAQIADEIDEELDKLQSGMNSLEARSDNLFGEKSVEQAKKEYENQAEKYRELIEELDIACMDTSAEGGVGNAIDSGTGYYSEGAESTSDNTGAEVSLNASTQYTAIVNSLSNHNVLYRPVQLFGRERSSEEIVQRLSGGDNTEGSCSSLALAYVGNKAGYDVLDFRDGESRAFFSSRSNIEQIAKLPGVQSSIVYGTDDVSSAYNLLEGMMPGKEYYLATGQHAAIVRKNGYYYEYLELQHPSNGNGWHDLDSFVLENRFGCSTSRWQKNSNYMIEVDSLSSNQEFINMLGYINTADNEQRKGASGHVR